MSSTLPRVLVWIPYRSVDGELADTIDAVVAQTHDPLECQIQVELPGVAALETAQRCAQLYPNHDIRVVHHHMDDAIRNTTASLVLPLRPGQILWAEAVAQLVEARHHDESLSVVFSQPAIGVPPGPDQPELDEVTRKPRAFECALYHRDALVNVGFDPGFDGSYATWDLWVRLLSAGHRFRRLHRALLADVEGIERECLWTLSLDPEQELDLGHWGRLVHKNRAHFPSARVELADAILEQGEVLAPETRLQLVQALHDDGWPEAARPHAEVLLRDGAPGLLPGAQAWLTHLRGMSQLACGQRAEAVESFHHALEIQPANAEAHGMLARIAQAEGNRDRALRHAEDALELEPAEEWRHLVDALAPLEPACQPYVVFYPGAENDDGKQVMWPVFETALGTGTCATTFIAKDQRHGLPGEGFALAHARMNRRPDALVVSRSWWGEAHEVAKAAKTFDVPVVMVHDGAMFLRRDKAACVESIYPADVNCLWGWRDLELWQGWNLGDRFVVTGNPCHDVLAGFRPEPVKAPERYALWLVHGKTAVPDSLRQQIDIVVPASSDPRLLLNLIHGSEFVVSDASPAMLPALYFQKPIFLRGHGHHLDEFRRSYGRVFNFKSDADWSAHEIQDAIRPAVADYEHFAHKADGNNTRRVLDVIEEYAFRSRAERPQAVALLDPEATAWA